MFVARLFLVPILILLATINAFSQNISDSWVTDSSKGFVARSNCSSIVINDSIYVIGGRGFANIGADKPRIQKFSPRSHTWSTVTAKGDTTASGEAFAIYSNDSIFVVWPDFGNAVSVYSLLTGVWDSLATAGQNTPRDDAASAVLNGKLYVIGGYSRNSGEIINAVDIFDPSTRIWASILPAGHYTPRVGLSASTLNGKIYAIGGNTGGFNTNIVEVFDSAIGSWNAPSFSGVFTHREFFASSALNDKIYCIGGDTDGIGGYTSKTVEVFDPATNTWLSATPMPTPRTWLSSVAWEGKIYAIGGYTPHEELNTVEVFTPGTQSVSRLTNSSNISVFPDPSPSRTTIALTLPEEGEVSLSVTDAAGRETPLLPAQYLSAGQHEVTWAASNYPSGVYLCRIEAGGQSATRRVVVMH